MSNSTSIYDEVTNKILAKLEAGVKPWVKPWSTGNVSWIPKRANGKDYSGMNILLLWGALEDGGFTQNTWMTFKQAQELKACVRKGEKGSPVVFADTFTKTEEVNGQEKEKRIPFMKKYTVFNIEQIDGLPEKYYVPATPQIKAETKRQDICDFVSRTNAHVRHGGSRAFFRINGDLIQMPPFESFISPDHYYSTLLHELTHWSGGPSRLDRKFGNKFGDPTYAKEELIAEIGSAYLCAYLGVDDLTDHNASYLESWIKALKNDSRAIFTAASQASKAAEYIRQLAESNSLLIAA